jgi:16S rRNA (guanine966-N2)-methyltransferase
MRVTGGHLGGRPIPVPRAEVRPTSDRVREALFSILGERVPGARVADLFAGSGSLGLEALSRGAEAVWWVERSHRVLRTLRETVKTLGRGCEAELRVITGDATRFLSASGDDPPVFDLIFADPPYGSAWAEKTLRLLAERPILRPSGLVILEQGAKDPMPSMKEWEILRDKKYGDTRVVICRRPEPDATEEPA